MAEQEFFAAAVFAFLGWMAATALAVMRIRSLTSGSSKAVCWIVPVIGMLMAIYLVYDGFYGETSGFRAIALGVLSLALYFLAAFLPLAQLLFGYFAKVSDRGDQ